MKTFSILGVACASLVSLSCSDTTTNPPSQLNLDRPVDVAFACYGGLRLTGGGAATADQEVTVTAQPLQSCDIRSQVVGSETQRPPGQEDLGPMSMVPTAAYFAFVLQSGPGTVAVASFSTKPSTAFTAGDVTVLDADALTPGKNSITVGEDPIAIGTDKVGCYEVIANAGSCDLSVLDINSVFTANSGVDPIVNRMVVRNGMGAAIMARPAAMVVESPGGTIGEACPAQPTGLAYIAYPSCHLVAGVDLATGTMVTGVQFDAAGVPTVVDGMTMVCPAECDGTGAITPGFRPVALDLETDARTQRKLLTIGADNSNLVTLYDLDINYKPFTMSQVALQNTTGRLGITSLAISPVIGMGGSTGTINDDFATAGDHQFLYGVANDGSVRVADITASTTPRECDAQVDPRYLRNVKDVDVLSCLTVGDAATPPRRAGARGPGIELIGDAIPTSVDTFRVEENDVDLSGPDKLVGYFGVISASNGQSFLFNIDDDSQADAVDNANPIETQIPLTIPHQLRDDIKERGLLAGRTPTGGTTPKFVCDEPGPDPDTTGGNIGGARLAGNIQRNVPTGQVAVEKTGGLPSIRQVFCDAEDPSEEDLPVSELSFSAPLDVRDAVFPDLRGLRADETWSLTWEGSLSLDSGTVAIDGPAVHESQMFVDGAGMRIVDLSRPFCEAGVEPYDILQMRGCDPSLGDAGCPLGYTCFVHPQSQVPGLGSCMLEDEAEPLANACRAYLTSLRRYTIVRAKSGELQLLPRKSVLRTTPTTGCIDDTQCKSLATYALSNSSSQNPFEDTTAEDTHSWACQVDPDRRPELDGAGQPLKRCIATCDDLERSSDCNAGTVCTAHPGALPKAGYCMEGVTPPQACVNSPQRYELRAGDAFAVVGTRSGFMHPVIADAGGNCVKDPAGSPLLAGRIPLRAPACDPTADPRTGQRPDGTFEPNPCQTTVQETEYQLNYVEGTCTLADPDESIVTRDATALKLRNKAMTLTLVDPTYQGDLRCHGDRGGSLVDVPLVTQGYQLAFRQALGFTPKTLKGLSPSFPIKVTRGPGQSIWIVDEGDFLSTSITQASTRGKVYRVESSTFVVNLLE